MTKKIKINKVSRYILVILILVGVMFFGRNYNFALEQQELLNRISDLNRSISGYYRISSEGDLVLRDKINSSPGELVVVSFNIFNRKKTFTRNQGFIEKLSFIASDEVGGQKIIGEYEPKIDLDQQRIEFQFKSDKNYRDLLIRKAKNDDVLTELNNIRVDKYISSDDSEGVKNYSGHSQPEIVIPMEGGKQKPVRLWRRNQKIGEVFTAQSDNLYGGEFKIRFNGTGGKGSYLIEVRELDNDKISAERLAYWYFDKRGLELLGQVSEDTYYIPIVAKLEKGKQYYIGFSSAEVNNNWFNSIDIFVGPAMKKIADPIGGAKISLFQQSNKFYTLRNKDYLGNKMLFGSTITLVDGKKFFRYAQIGRPAEYLDIYRVEGERAKYSALYDNVSEHISGQLSEGAAIIYKFETTFSYNRANIKFSEIAGGYCGVKAYWSYDDKNWQEIVGDNFSNPNNPLSFTQNISGNGGSQIFLKITYDSERQHDKNINLYGISDLRITVE